MFTFLPCGVFMRTIRTVFFSIGLSLLSVNALASGDHNHEGKHDHQSNTTQAQHAKDQHLEHDEYEHNVNDHHEDEHDHTENVTIDDTTAKQSNIKTAHASSGFVMSTQRVFGKVVNDASQISHIGARFDGTIMQVNVSVGQTVKKGDKLARIESNQSLHPYYVEAPFNGMIIERHANPGELTQDQPLFTLFNDNIL
jgi:cobalt-zinc-cadmium efflux system membrane fusion protein